MTCRHLAIALALTLTACQAPPAEHAPSYAVSTVTADLPDPTGLASGPDGILVSTPRGILHMGPDDPLATVASGPPLKEPAGLSWSDGKILAADPAANRIWQVPSPAGKPTPFAGTGTALLPLGDGGLATSAQLNSPSDVALAPDGSAFVADTGNRRIRRIDPEGRISTVPGTEEAFERPVALARGADGTLWVVDAGLGELKRIQPDGTVATLARDLASPQGVLPAGSGALVSETGKNRVVWVGPSGTLVPVVGGGSEAAESGAGTAIALTHPSRLAPADGAGIYLLDGDRILLLTPSATP